MKTGLSPLYDIEMLIKFCVFLEFCVFLVTILCPFSPIFVHFLLFLSVLFCLFVMTNSMSILSYFLSGLSVMTNSMSILPVLSYVLSVLAVPVLFFCLGQNGQ